MKIYLLLFITFFWFSGIAQINNFKETQEKKSSLTKIEKQHKNNSILKNYYYNLDSLNLNRTKIKDTLYLYIKINRHTKKKKIHFTNLETELKAVNDSLIKSGYLFSKLIPDSISIRKERLNLYMHTNLKVTTKIDEVVISPQKTFPKNISRYINRIFKGKIIDSSNLEKIATIINRTTKATIKKTPQIFFKNHKSVIWIDAPINKPNTADGFISFSYDNEKGQLKLEASANTSLYNLFKQNEQISFKWYQKDDYQLIDWKIYFPYLKGSNFYINNHFFNSRTDTIQTNLINEIALGYRYHNYSFYLSQMYNHIQSENKENTNHIGLGFEINGRKNGYFAREIKGTLKIETHNTNKNIYYFTGKYYLPLFKSTLFYTQYSFFFTENNQDNNYINTYPNLFRKTYITINNISKVSSFKNEWFLNQNKTKFYLIGDYINIETSQKQSISYLNIGIGMKILNKNQILTLEIINPINNDYIIDNQGVYINIKQQFRF